MSFTMPATEMDESVVTKPSGGEVTVTRGGVVSSVMLTLAVPVTPFALVATAVIVLGPSATGSASVKDPFATGTGIEFTATVAVASSTVPLTVVGVLGA